MGKKTSGTTSGDSGGSASEVNVAQRLRTNSAASAAQRLLTTEAGNDLQQAPPAARQAEDWLAEAGIELLCEWDVLVFLYRHLTTLAGADRIARLVGHPIDEVVAALDRLETLGFVERSRADQDARIYQFAVESTPRPDSPLARLLLLAETRAGRLLLSGALRCGSPAEESRGHLKFHRAGGKRTWRIAS